MDNHIKILAILHIIYGALKAIFGILIYFFARVLSIALIQLQSRGELSGFNGLDVEGLIYCFASVVSLILIILGVAGIISGWGLLTRQSWARIMVVIVGILNLIKIPFGTALGIYTLWVYFRTEPKKTIPTPTAEV